MRVRHRDHGLIRAHVVGDVRQTLRDHVLGGDVDRSRRPVVQANVEPDRSVALAASEDSAAGSP